MLSEAKVIRSDEQHQNYLNEIQELIILNPQPGSQNFERLELISILTEAYENRKYPVEPPDPIEAITFRMQEQGLKQSDLVPYFGTRSRVSEVLSRKRPLTVNMIRSLSIGLGISTETLVGITNHEESSIEKNDVDWGKFPVKEILARGWLDKIKTYTSKSTEDLVKSFINESGINFGLTAYRRSIGGEAYSPATKYALYAWLARVTQQARDKKNKNFIFDRSQISNTFLRELAQLSWFEHGPALSVEYLEKYGITLIVEPSLKGTLLDGAAFLDEDGSPIIGLTLRFDRIDNFWFTLLHEVAHLWKHLNSDETFLDNLDATSSDKREIEANRIARDALIPRISWKRSDASINPTHENIDSLSRELKIHPAIIAGRIRREKENYMLFNDLIGHGEVRKHFSFLQEER